MQVANEWACGSDHFPLLLSVGDRKVASVHVDNFNQTRRGFNFDKACWPVFTTALEECVAKSSFVVDIDAVQLEMADPACSSVRKQFLIDKIWRTYECAIDSSCSAGMPRLRWRDGKQASLAPWWKFNPNLPAMRARYLRLQRLSRKPRNQANYYLHQCLKSALNDWKNGCRKAKRAFFTSQLQHAAQYERKNISDFWATIHKMSPSVSSSLRHIRHPDTMSSAPDTHAEAVNNAAEFLSRVFVPNDPKDELAEKVVRRFDEADFVGHSTHDYDQKPFKASSLRQLLFKIDVDSSGGPDLLRACILRNIPMIALEWLALLFTVFYRHGIVPNAFRVSRVVMIYKGKGEKCDAGNYRPISVTSIFARLYEHALAVRVKSMLPPNFFAPTQFGFRAMHRTHHQVSELIDRIITTMHAKGWLPVVFCDIARAFDKVPHEHLLFKLYRAGVTGNVLRAIRALLLDRQFFVEDRGMKSNWHACKAGTPQGMVLSPLLFLIFINSAIKSCTTSGIICLAYADDLVIFPTSALLHRKSTETIESLQWSLNLLSNWADRWRLRFSPQKSALVIFTKRKLAVTIEVPRLYLTGFVLEVADSYTYLGYPLTSTLSWKKLKEELISQMNSRNYLISRIVATSSRSGYLHFGTIRMLMLNWYVSPLNYYFPLARFADSDYAVFNTMVAKPLKCALALPKYTPTMQLLSETGFLPMQTLAKLSLLRLLESMWNLQENTLQQQRLVKEWFPHPYKPMDKNYAALDSVARLGRSAMREFDIGLTTTFLNPYRQKFEPLHPIVTSKFVTEYGGELTKKELKEKQWRQRYPSYLKLDKLAVAQLRVRLRLRVSKLAADQYRLRLTPWPSCPHCTSKQQDAEHMIMECPELSRIRTTAFQSLHNIDVSPKLYLFLGHVIGIPESNQRRVLHITGQFLLAAKQKGYNF
jgi:hypothetical protein